jgi:hypothetical protein
MSIEKTAIKNERPAVMATPKVRPPGEGDIQPVDDGEKAEDSKKN